MSDWTLKLNTMTANKEFMFFTAIRDYSTKIQYNLFDFIFIRACILFPWQFSFVRALNNLDHFSIIFGSMFGGFIFPDPKWNSVIFPDLEELFSPDPFLTCGNPEKFAFTHTFIPSILSR